MNAFGEFVVGCSVAFGLVFVSCHVFGRTKQFLLWLGHVFYRNNLAA
jgi:hypothetical protein